jgi:hypothetical protein
MTREIRRVRAKGRLRFYVQIACETIRLEPLIALRWKAQLGSAPEH